MGTSLAIASQIFEGDPNRPGAGYVQVNGKSYRIEGTTQQGGTHDQGGLYIPTAQDQYILDAGGGNTILGPNINVSDYTSWLYQSHASDSPAASLPNYQVPTGFDETSPNQITLAPDAGTSGGSSGSSSSGSSGGGRGILSPSGPLDTNPSGQLPLSGSIPAGGTDTLAISGGGVSISSQQPTPGAGLPAGSGGGSGTTSNTTPGTSGTTGTPGSTDQSLLDLLAAMYGAGGGGGSNADTSLGGLLAGPVNTATGADAGVDSSAPAQTGMSNGAKLLILLVVGGLAFWWWKRHHKKGGAK